MILTYKIKHGRDFAKELVLARKVVDFGLEHKSLSSRGVKHFGLKSLLSNQILRKYVKNNKLKQVKNIKLTVPNQGIKIKENKIYVPCLKLTLNIFFPKDFTKINQIELGKEFAYISATYKEPKQITPVCVLGVDRNTNHHVLVASNLQTGKVLKLGKSCNHIHKKYKMMRKSLQKQGKLKKVKSIKDRESRIVKDINHKISRKLVDEALKVKGVIVFEDLKGISRTSKTKRKSRYSLHSWSFYQLQWMIEYKSKKLGVSVVYVEPQYTSQRCSHCGYIEANNRIGILFHCKNCGVVEDSGANAGFNIGYLYQEGIPQFCKDRDLQKRSTDTLREATQHPIVTLEPQHL